MLTEKEKQFLAYWESSRERESSVTQKLRRGMPMALLFGLSMLVSLVLVFYLSPEWYTKISKYISRVTISIVVAIFISIFFFSFARMHFKWEMNEQYYLELKHKQKKDDAAEVAQ